MITKVRVMKETFGSPETAKYFIEYKIPISWPWIRIHSFRNEKMDFVDKDLALIKAKEIYDFHNSKTECIAVFDGN